MFEEIEPNLKQTRKAKGEKTKVVNVASVPQRSPFRYPGGKTWLIPIVRKWLQQSNEPKRLVEPFAGGGIVGLTAAFENLANHVTMVEKDEEVAAVWEVILNGQNQWLANRILNFELNAENLNAELENPTKELRDVAFCTILKNRTFHGGIICKGSGPLKHGENGKGIHSRWYPKTLHRRISAIDLIKENITFKTGDAFEELDRYKNETDIYFFIDPPYTKAGKRLYTYFDIDHEELFRLTSQLRGRFMLTYDDTREIRDLANKFNLLYREIPMKTTHHIEKQEIIISDNFDWWGE